MARFSISALRGPSLVLLTACIAMVLFLSPVSAQVLWLNSSSGTWDDPANNATNWSTGTPPTGGQVSISSGGTAVIDTTDTTYPASGSFSELWVGDGNTGTGGVSTPGNVVQQSGTTVNIANWFELGRLYQYNGAQVSAASNISTYTMNGNSVVNVGNGGGSDIGWAWNNGNGNSNTTGILTLNDSAQFIIQNFISLGTTANNGTGGAGIITLNGNSTLNSNGGNIYVGNGPTSSGTLNINNSATLSGWDIRAGVNGTGTVNQMGGVANVGGWLRLGEARGSVGYYNLSAGTVNANLQCRIAEDGTGTFAMSGNSVLNVGQDITMGCPIDNNSQPGNGTLTLTDNAVLKVAGNFWAGNGGGTGNVTVGSNASITLTGGGNLSIGDDNNNFNDNYGNGGGNGPAIPSSGTLTQTGGKITLSAGMLFVGNSSFTGNSSYSATINNGTYNMQGGVLNVANWIAVGRCGSTGVLNMSGGTINKTGGGNIDIGAYLNSGNGTWNMNGGLVLNNSEVWLGEGSNSGTFNLNGGTVQALDVVTRGGTGNFYFNGGVLQAIGNSGNFVNNSNSYVSTGGAIIDTNGHTVTITQGLQSLPGDGGLQKNGLGTLALSGVNIYYGPTTVNSGTLLITNNQFYTSGFEVKSGATLAGDASASPVVVDAGGLLAPGYTLTNPLATGNFQPYSLTSTGGTIAFKLSNNTASGNDQITVGSDLSLTNVTINISNLLNASLSSGTYTLISAPSNTQTLAPGTLTLTGLPHTRQTYTLDYSTSPTSAVNLDVSAATAASLIWRGGSNPNPTAWDIQTTPNWYNTGTSASDVFYQLDNVTFDDTAAAANRTVNITASVQPGSVTLNPSSTCAYTFTGAGTIGGATGMVMNGAGSLTVQNTNTYTGTTIVNNGTLIVNQNGVINGTSLLALSGGSNQTSSLSLADSGSVTVNGQFQMSFGSNAAASLNLAGNSSMTVTAGPFQVTSGGTLNLFGSASLTINGGWTGFGSTNSPTQGVATLNMGDHAVLTSAGDIIFGDNSNNGLYGYGVANVSGGTMNTNGGVSIGKWGDNLGGAQGLMTLSGTGASPAVINSKFFYVGDSEGSTTVLASGTMSMGGNSIVNDSGEFDVGFRARASGYLTMTGGTINANNFYVGHWDSSTGTATIGGTALVISNGDALVGFNQNSSGHLVLKDSGSYLQTAGYFYIAGNNNSSGTLTMSGSSNLNIASGDITIGNQDSASGVMVMNGNATASSRPGYSVYMARSGNATGSLTLNDNTTLNTGYLQVGGGGSGGGSMTVNDNAQVNATTLLNVGADTGGTMTQNGGNVLIGSVDESRIGGANSGGSAAVGTYTMNGGTLTVEGNFQPGAFGTGYLIQTGGVVNSGGWHAIGRFPGGVGLQTISGGTFNATNTGTHLIVGEQGTGTLTISGSGLVNCVSDLWMALNEGNPAAPGTGTVNLNGGTLATSGVDYQGGNAATFNFDGGLLRATNDNATFMQGLTAANVQDGGAVVDSNGHSITIGQALVAWGTGGLTKIGDGMLTLSGVNTYTGGTTVLAGTLDVANPLSILDGTSLTVGADAMTIFGTAAAPLAASASVAVSPVPEPGTLALLIVGAAVGFGVWRRRKAK